MYARGLMIGTAESFRVFLPEFVKVGTFDFDKETTNDHAAAAITGSPLMGSNGIDGSTAVDFAGDYGIVSGAVIDISYSGPDAFGYIGTTEDGTSFVENLDDIAVLDTPLFGFRRVQPKWFIQITIMTSYLAGDYLVEPVEIIKLGMYSPPRMVRAYQQGIFLCPVKQQAFLMGFTVWYPMRYRRSFFIIWEMFG